MRNPDSSNKKEELSTPWIGFTLICIVIALCFHLLSLKEHSTAIKQLDKNITILSENQMILLDRVNAIGVSQKYPKLTTTRKDKP